ncbi:hypothetical protein [Salipiger thiooxidans]|uniref:hypothetical protein n=1 Tax=Salipiger thiooxidans TaxID=282683 RepID=UPI001CD3DCBB|nr:hypothetical protein [Salipiger thiooxidans]MCA0846060.1 hypothetical protein [Salipiger thiooxidans]
MSEKDEERLRQAVNGINNNLPPPTKHADLRQICDWELYGPKDPRIYILVRELALSHGLRVSKIEEVIVAALSHELDGLRNAEKDLKGG